MNRRWTAGLAAAVVTVGLSVALAAPVSAQPGGPCGQTNGGSAPGSGPGSAPGSGPGSANGSLGISPPWITGPPDGRLPILTGRTRAIEMVTGPGSPNNTIGRFSVSGTDLGIMWDNEAGQVLIAFGDTVGDCDIPGGEWRSNVLFRSGDRTLPDGMRIDSSPLAATPPNFSRQVINGLLGQAPGSFPEFTVIPTGGVSVGGVQFVRWMSVRSWDQPGEWTTNYSGLAASTDNGETWNTDVRTVRANFGDLGIPGIPPLSPANFDWQMSAFVPNRGDGYVYEFATPSGRSGAARLARVPANPTDMVDPARYEYRTASGWSPNIEDAVPVIPAPVSELSVQWNDFLNTYVAMYQDAEGLKIRQADQLWGPWSGAQTLISMRTLPTVYGGFMHPWSSGSNLFFVVTTWDRYNVIYMRTDLRGMRIAATDAVDRPDPAVTGEQRLQGFQSP